MEKQINNQNGYKLLEGEEFYTHDLKNENRISQAHKYNEDNILSKDETKIILGMDKTYREEEGIKKEIEQKERNIRIINRIRELNDGWRPIWHDTNVQDKWYFCLVGDQIELASTYISRYLPPEFYLKSEELAHQLVDEMEVDLIRWLSYENWNWLEV